MWAYVMRISDWSSDVCSSDLGGRPALGLEALVEQVDGVVRLVAGEADRVVGGAARGGRGGTDAHEEAHPDEHHPAAAADREVSQAVEERGHARLCSRAIGGAVTIWQFCHLAYMSSVTVPPADGAHRYGSDMAAAPVSLREKTAAQTRQRIVDVALGLFVDQGFDATTVGIGRAHV